MNSFESQFDIPGMHKLNGVSVSTATPTDKIIENIKVNRGQMQSVHHMREWREGKPVAIVGGGPSLETQLDELKKYPIIFACGSVHDYLIEKGIIPSYCVICDPDPVMNTYLSRHNEYTKYLIASQCDPSTFKLLEDRNSYIYHLASDVIDMSLYGDKEIPVGGGCTVGTRAMVMCINFGFYNLHLFGMDTCLSEKDGATKHHAYEFNTKEEKIDDVHSIKFEIDGPIFNVAGYHLGQLFDIKGVIKQYSNVLNITVHGDSLLSYFMELARKRSKLKEEYDKKVKENGDNRELNGVGPSAISG